MVDSTVTQDLHVVNFRVIDLHVQKVALIVHDQALADLIVIRDLHVVNSPVIVQREASVLWVKVLLLRPSVVLADSDLSLLQVVANVLHTEVHVLIINIQRAATAAHVAKTRPSISKVSKKLRVFPAHKREIT